jgi:hypothetical protein
VAAFTSKPPYTFNRTTSNAMEGRTLPCSYQCTDVAVPLKGVSRVLPGRTQGQFHKNPDFSPNWSW